MKAVPKRCLTRARSVLWHIRDRVDYDRLDLIVQPAGIIDLVHATRSEVHDRRSHAGPEVDDWRN